MASVRSCKRLPTYLIKPVPPSSKMDPPPAKAKPISNSDIFKKGKNTVGKRQSRERSETM